MSVLANGSGGGVDGGGEVDGGAVVLDAAGDAVALADDAAGACSCVDEDGSVDGDAVEPQPTRASTKPSGSARANERTRAL